jgi:peptide/nickel transport system substrate-binding protein
MGDIVPELATSWAWDSAGTTLSFKLRDGVTWHDGKPFTANDVKCTFDLLQDKAQDKFRKNPRRDLFNNIAEVTASGDFEVALHLKRPQPSLLAMIASGYTPIYPCHVTPAQMRTHPIGTGPYKFVEFKQNESIKLARNENYWRKGLPYLDGIEFTIISNRATAVLAFVAGKVDMTFPTELTQALVQDIKKQDATADSRLRRCQQRPRAGPRDHGEARLRSEQPAQNQSSDAQSRDLSRSGRGPDRSIEDHQYRCRARRRGVEPMVRQDRAQ